MHGWWSFIPRVSIRGLLWHYDVLELAKVERPKA